MFLAPSSDDPHAFLSGGGRLGQLIAALDWASTPLGDIRGWRQSLKTAVSIVLRSEVPIVMLWGTSGVMLYNDAYSIFAGGRHPQLLGSNVRDGWPEVASFNDHVMNVCLSGGTLAFRDQELTLYRSGTAEQVWMNLDYSPILDEEGQPAGVIAIVIETTEKVKADLWRKGERDRQKQMFDQAPGFMAMMSGPDHVFELTNAAYMQLVGHRDLIGLPVRKALPDVEGQGFFELLDQVYQTGERFVGTAIKARIQRVKGAPAEERSIDLVYQPVSNPGGEVIGIFVQGVDVTERLAAEDAVRRSEAQFRTFAESMPHHVWTARPDGHLDWLNPRVYAYSGAAPGKNADDVWAEMSHPDDHERMNETWQTAMRTGLAYESEFRLKRHDGAFRWHIGRAVPIRNENDDLIQWIGTNTDIHDQKVVAERLAESERRLHLSQNAAGISALELDIASGTVYGTDSFWDIWGLSRRESVHISVLESIVLPEDKEIRSTPETRVKGTATPNVEYRIRRPDNGELRWLSRNIHFVYDDAGTPIKMFGVVQDITARKTSEVRQQMLTHELEHRNKNILAMVSAIASQTLRNTDLETGRKVFSDRLRALGKAHDLLNDTRWTDASLHQVVTNTVAVFPPHQISVDGPPVALSPKMALTLALAINELGTNALKYGALSKPGGTVAVRWSLTHRKQDDAGEFKFSWVESGGPKVSPPSRRGFGTFLVERVLASDFDGAVTLDYLDTGVVCVLTAPDPMPKVNAN